MATNTTATATTHTGNGSTNNFAISFSFLANNEVDVTVAGVLKTLDTHYTISGSTVTFTSGNTPANGAAVKFQRDTNISAKKVDFQDGSVLTETDLDTNSDQVLFAQQEITDKLSGIEEGATGDQTAAEIRTLVESASDSNVFTDADHSKLNAIEASATADQTAAEIRTLVESASDSNVFTDADHTKLNNIEANATADQTAAEIRTLVESATDSNVFTDADHSKLNAIEAGATADQTNAEIRAAVEAASDSNVFTDADHSKLNAIEANATADQTASEIKTLYESNSNTNALTDAEKTVIDGVTANTSELNKLDGFTGSTADLNQVSGMSKQTTITNSDSHFPTSGAVVDFVANQIAPVGGLEVIADEDNFPATQPVSGVVISISNADGLVINSSGVATNARTVGSGSDNVTINNFPTSLRNKTLSNELGLLVSSTGASQVYNYHKLLAKETDVLQLSDDINDFNNRYRVVSSNPTSNNDAGDLIFNTSTSKLLVYNATSGAFEEAQSIGNFFISTLSPAFDGSTQDFTITNAPTNAQQIILSINGVIQKPNAGSSTPSEGFALSGSTVKLAAAPASGSDYFAIVLGSTVNIGTPSNNTVTSATIVDGSIVNGDISNSADIAGSKLNLVSTSSTAGVIVKGDGSSDGYLQLNCSQNSHGVKIKSPPHSANASYTLTLPNTTGTNGQALKTNGAGVLSFGNVLGGNSEVIALYDQSSTPIQRLLATGEGVTVQGTSAGVSKLMFRDRTTANFLKFKPVDTLSADVEFTLPSADGSTGQFLKTNGSGVLSFATVDAGVTSDAQGNTVAGTNAGDSFTGTDAVNNTLIGKDAGTAITTGDQNTAVGSGALDANTTASHNTAIGFAALSENTTGHSNTAVGDNALVNSTTANSSTAVGRNALNLATTGGLNTAVGAFCADAITTGSENTAMGVSCLTDNTTGSNNTAIGRSAMLNNTTANNNTAVGHQALQSNTTGDFCTAVGKSALKSNVTGQGNTALGQEALMDNTGHSNTGLGNRALYENTSGRDNTAVGNNCLTNVTTENYITAVGSYALHDNTSGSQGVAVGYSALANNTTGDYNTGVGTYVMDSNTTGEKNTAMGYQALSQNSSGSQHTAIGHYALRQNTTGLRNTAVGHQALYQNTTAHQNTAVGYDCMRDNQTGYSCTAVGHGALDTFTTGYANDAFGVDTLRSCTTGVNNVSLGYASMALVTTGAHNVAIGTTACSALTTGNSNIIIGRNCDVSSATVSNEITLASNTSGNGSGTFYVHSTSGAYNGTNSSSWSQTSDERIKKNINNFDTGLSVINQLQVKTFEYKTKDEIKSANPELTDVLSSVENVLDISGVQKGLIAQEAEAVDSKLVTTPSTGIKALQPDDIFWYMLNAIKELSAKVTALEAG